MKVKFIDFIKKFWLPLWCIITSLSLFCMLAAAKYETSSSAMKKVVRSTSDQGRMFSSNILIDNGENTYYPIYKQALSDDEKPSGTYDVNLYLWNYSLSNITKFYPIPIDYNLTLKFTNASGTPLSSGEINGRSVSLYKENDDTPLLTLNSTTAATTVNSENNELLQTIGNNTSESDEVHYVLQFSGANWNLENDTDICVQIKAEPYNGGDDSKYQDLSTISAVIGLKESVDLGQSAWEAHLAEKQANCDITKCDAFNLVTTGSGKAVITIKWDTTKLTCNKYFYNNTIYDFGTYNIDVDEETTTTINEVDSTGITNNSNIATLVINADAANEVTNFRNRYDIQFYKVGITLPANWNFFADDGSDLSSTVWLSVNIEDQ